MTTLTIHQSASGSTSMLLSPTQSDALRQLIEQHIDCRFTSYIRQIGLDPTNVWPVFTGRKRLTHKMLLRLLSKTDLELECHLEFMIRTPGETVQDVPSVSLEEQLFLEAGEESEMDALTGTDTTCIGIPPQILENAPPNNCSSETKGRWSYLSERPQENKKIPLDSPSKEEPE